MNRQQIFKRLAEINREHREIVKRNLPGKVQVGDQVRAEVLEDERNMLRAQVGGKPMTEEERLIYKD